MRSTRGLGLVLATVLALAACGGAGESGENGNGEADTSADRNEDAVLKVGISALNPPTWDVHKVGLDYTNFTTFPVYDRILDADASGEVVPGLADEWTFDDAGTQLTLHMREGATFQDGSPVDAESVKANLERQLNGGDEMLNAGQLASIASVEAPDDSTVVLKLKSPDASLPAILASRAGALICPAAFDSPDLATKPCGAGPFAMVSHRDDDRTVYERFDDYWNRAEVHLGGLEFIYVPDETTRVNAFQAGQFDLTYVNTTAIDTAIRAGIEVDPEATLTFWQLNLNRSRKPLDDVRVRQAINYALDRDALVKALLFDQALPATQMFPPSYYAFDSDLPDPYWPHDPERAKELLAESGAQDVSFNCVVSSGSNGAFAQYAEVIAEQLAEVGITMTFDTVTQSTHYTERNTDCEIGVFAGAIDPSIAFRQLFAADGFFNPSGKAEPEVEAAIAASLKPGEERVEAIADMVELAQEQALLAPLFFPYRSYLKTDRVQGLGSFPVDTTTRFVGVGLSD